MSEKVNKALKPYRLKEDLIIPKGTVFNVRNPHTLVSTTHEHLISFHPDYLGYLLLDENLVQNCSNMFECVEQKEKENVSSI